MVDLRVINMVRPDYICDSPKGCLTFVSQNECYNKGTLYINLSKSSLQQHNRKTIALHQLNSAAAQYRCTARHK